jgi:hypothetical protein
MILLVIDVILCAFKIHSGYYAYNSNFERGHLARYNRFSICFYVNGIFKMLLINLAFLTGGVVVSIPIYTLTLYYIAGVCCMPMLTIFLRLVDSAHVRTMQRERTDTIKKQTADELKQRIAMMFLRKKSITADAANTTAQAETSSDVT